MDVFGSDRVLFGSDWPNSDGVTSLDKIVNLARQYLATRSRAEAENVLWRNSAKVYKWVHRAANQPLA
jgi:predicted TIM-barrel fold metal-dependent hydrolase